MSGRSGSHSCLVLPDKKDLSGIVGVGVLLHSYSSASVNAKSGSSSEDIPTYRASIVFVSQCIEQDNDVYKAVRITQYKRLQPGRVRTLGLGLGQNLMSRTGRWLNKRLSNSLTNYSPASSLTGQSLSKIEFKVWCVDERQEKFENKSSKNEKNRKVSFNYNDKCECSYIEIFKTIDEQDEKILWEIAGFLAKKIAERDCIFLEHFGFLMSSCEAEQKKVKNAINRYTSLKK